MDSAHENRKNVYNNYIQLIGMVVSQVLSQGIAGVLSWAGIPAFICNIFAGVLYILLALLAMKLICGKYVKAPMDEYYVPRFHVKWQWLLIAVALLVLVSIFYFMLPGSFEQNTLSFSQKLTVLSGGIFYTGFAAGIVEEMVFRGMIMNAVEKRYNKTIAVIAPSLLFGLLHILGMDLGALNGVLVIIAGTMVGIMFSLIASAERSIWNSAIVHAVWNIVIIGGILYIGKEADSYSLYSYVLRARTFLLTGGEFGIESSAAAAVGYCVVSLIAFRSINKKEKSIGIFSRIQVISDGAIQMG